MADEAAYAAVVTLFTRDENRAVGTYSATTAIAGMLTFALGAYALLGDLRVWAGTAVAAAGLLAFREELHGCLENIPWPKLQSGLIDRSSCSVERWEKRLALWARCTLSKIAIGAVIGRGPFAVEIAAMALLCLLVGTVALWLIFVFAA